MPVDEKKIEKKVGEILKEDAVMFDIKEAAKKEVRVDLFDIEEAAGKA